MIEATHEPFDTYLASGAVGHSSLTVYANEGFERWHAYHHDGQRRRSPSPEMEYGTALDDLVAYGWDWWDARYARVEGDLRSTEARTMRKEHPNKTLLAGARYDAVLATAERVLADLEELGMTHAQRQAVLRGECEGIPVQSRPDFLLADDARVVDLKTTSDVLRWGRDFTRFGYHLQVGIAALLGVKRFAFLVVESSSTQPQRRYADLDTKTLAWCVSQTEDVLRSLAADIDMQAFDGAEKPSVSPLIRAPLELTAWQQAEPAIRWQRR